MRPREQRGSLNDGWPFESVTRNVRHVTVPPAVTALRAVTLTVTPTANWSEGLHCAHVSSIGQPERRLAARARYDQHAPYPGSGSGPPLAPTPSERQRRGIPTPLGTVCRSAREPPCLLPVQTAATGRGGSPAARSGAQGWGLPIIGGCNRRSFAIS